MEVLEFLISVISSLYLELLQMKNNSARLVVTKNASMMNSIQIGYLLEVR